jgi:hypothetical protein
MVSSHIATGTITALLATALVYLTLAAPASRAAPRIRFCRPSGRRWRRRGQILQIADHACRGAARTRSADRANEPRA